MDNLASFTDVLDDDEICNSQPISLTLSNESNVAAVNIDAISRPAKGTGQRGQFRSTEEIDPKYRDVFTYPYFNLVQSEVIDDALYTDKSIVVCAPTGSGKTVIFEMAIVQLLMELEDKQYTEDFKIIYMAPVKALCTERLTEWYPKFTKLGLLCIEATGDTDVDFTQLKPYKIIITTPEKWDMLTRRWRDHKHLVEVIKLFLIDEVHILNDEARGPVLEAVVSRMKTIESSAQSVHRIEKLQNQMHGTEMTHKTAPSIRFVAVSATVSNPEDVANWLGTDNKSAVFHKFGDECRPVRLKRIVEGYPCPEGTSIFKFDIILNYKLWPVIQKYHSGKPTLIFCNTRKSVILTAETLSRELTINFSAEQKAKLTALASTIKNKKLQSLVMCGVGCHHAGLLYEERQNIEFAFRNRDLPILITTTTLAMGVNLPAHLVIIKNTQQYVNGAYQEYSISTVLQMVGRAGRPQFDTDATAVIMTRLADKARYQALVGGCEPLQSFLHKRLPENLNSEAALGTVGDVAQCVQWLRSTFLYVRAARDPKKYLNLPQNSPQQLISKKIEELCVRAMNGLASAGLITMDEASCITSTEAGRLMSIFYLDLETMKLLMKIEGTESLDRLLSLICESHELADMHLRVDERRCLNALNRNNAATTIRFPMKGKITTRQMKLNCIIQAVLGCLAIPDPSLNQEAMKIMRIADRVCKCLVAYVTRSDLISSQPQFYSAVLNSIILAKCIASHLWEISPFVSKQLKGIGPTFSTLLATAGKVNFMLLEESHPRDLERIMNKGPPAGNILRKQISLLPKYQLTMIPIDESTVMLQLVLLNQNFLAEHIEELTAGPTHKSYIVVGDSNNHILLLASFKDKDLLSIFDGTISHEIRRKHNYEHKILAHCISSTFVGVDVHTEYGFNDLDQFFGGTCTNNNVNETPVKESVKRQTCITDTFKERKRKSTTNLDNTQSKEKKKRDNAIMENFKYLKKTFETASKNVKESMNLTTSSNKIPNYANNLIPEKENLRENKVDDLKNITSEVDIFEDIDSDDYMNDAKVDSILAEIENEMFKKKVCSIKTNHANIQHTDITKELSKFQKQSTRNEPMTLNLLQNCKTSSDRKKRKPFPHKSNYNFIELLERNMDLSDDDDNTAAPNKNNGFSENIINQINNFIQKAETKAKVPNMNVQLLLENEEKATLHNKDSNVEEIVDSDTEMLTPTQKLYPHYEIKEILGGHNTIETHRKQTEKSVDKIDEHSSLKKVDNSYSVALNSNNEFIPKSKLSLPSDTSKSRVQDILMDETTDGGLIKETSQNQTNVDHFVSKDNITYKQITSPQIIDSNSQSKISEIKLNEASDREREINKNNVGIDSDIIFKYDIDNKEYTPPHLLQIDTNKSSLIGESIIVENIQRQINKNDEANKEESGTIFLDNITNAQNSEFHNVDRRLQNKETELNITGANITEDFLKKNDESDIAYKDESFTICIDDTDYKPTDKDRNDIILTDLQKTETTNNELLYDTGNTCTDLIESNQNKPHFTDIQSKNDHSLQIFNRNALQNPVPKQLETSESDIANEYTLSKTVLLPCIDNKCCINPLIKSVDIIPHTVTVNQAENENSVKSNLNLSSDNLYKENKGNENFRQNYSYSATKIGFYRKQIPPYCYEVVKKVQVDLNVTKIIPKDYCRQSDHAHYNDNLALENKHGTESCAHSSDYDSGQSSCQHENNSSKKLSIEETPQSQLQVECEITAKENVNDALDYIKENSIQNQDRYSSKSSYKDLDNTNIADSNKHKADDIIVDNACNAQESKESQHGNTLRWMQNTNSSPKVEEENDSTTEIGNNKVQNILKKYSKILRKDTTRAQTPNCSATNIIKTSKRSPKPKISKPFKITDIQTLHATLPDSIIDCNKQAAEENVAPITKTVFNEPITRQHTLPEYCSPVQVKADHADEDILSHHISNIDLDPIELPLEIDMQPVRDFKLDQSMFDPKTLLQSTVDSDDIIPPPPQFSDFTSSPNDNNFEESEYYSQFGESQHDTTNKNNYNEDIFEEQSITHLTPSREIETWTLEAEDRWEDNYSPPRTAKSFTVMRRNTPNFNDLSEGSNMNRQARLGQFKFSQKNKLRKWK